MSIGAIALLTRLIKLSVLHLGLLLLSLKNMVFLNLSLLTEVILTLGGSGIEVGTIRCQMAGPIIRSGLTGRKR